MAFEFFDYDPLTGVKESLAFEDGKIHVRYEQDIQPILDHNAMLRNQQLADGNWKKHDVALYARIPPVVQGQMLKKGINFLDQNHIGAVLKEINQNYPYLKVTDKVHNVK